MWSVYGAEVSGTAARGRARDFLAARARVAAPDDGIANAAGVGAAATGDRGGRGVNARRRLANRPVRFAAALLVLVTVAAMGCADQFGHMAVGPIHIKAFPNGQITRTSTATPVAIATALPIEVLQRRTSVLVSVRSSLRSGAIDVVAMADGEERSRRRLERIGENLILIFIPSSSGATLDLVQVANAGPLDVEIKRASFLNELEPDFARDVAADEAADFEANSGQLADPLVENLVPNASFAADDEVRGTPADWFAYVETSSNVLERRLRASGTAPGRRPYLATDRCVSNRDGDTAFLCE